MDREEFLASLKPLTGEERQEEYYQRAKALLQDEILPIVDNYRGRLEGLGYSVLVTVMEGFVLSMVYEDEWSANFWLEFDHASREWKLLCCRMNERGSGALETDRKTLATISSSHRWWPGDFERLTQDFFRYAFAGESGHGPLQLGGRHLRLV